MLTLTRHTGQIIVVGDLEKPLGLIHVDQAHNGKARLRFDFPHDLPINRLEIAVEKLRRDREDAATEKP